MPLLGLSLLVVFAVELLLLRRRRAVPAKA
jgi:uncharacterized iron-regulated membrane protein